VTVLTVSTIDTEPSAVVWVAELSKSSDGVCMCGGRGVTRIAGGHGDDGLVAAGGRELVRVVSTRVRL
jgi:hypothetical protein